jgi:AcrR family transcriptional regulator
MASAPRTRLPRDLRRKQIAVAARPIFATHGLAGAKTRQIADAAGVTERVLYRHFESKEDIFSAAILEPLEQLGTDLMRITSGFGRSDPKRRFQMSEHAHDEIRRVVQEITPLLGVALFSKRDAGLAFYQKRLAPLFDLAADAIRQAMAPRQQKIIDPEALFMIVVGLNLGICLETLFTDRAPDWDHVAQEMNELISFGLVAPADAFAGDASSEA